LVEADDERKEENIFMNELPFEHVDIPSRGK
jgi:hypothetical protein